MNKKIQIKISTYLVTSLLVSILLILIVNMIGYYSNRNGHEIALFGSFSMMCFFQFLISFTAYLNLIKKIRVNMLLRFLSFNFSSIISFSVILFLSKNNLDSFEMLIFIILPYVLCLMISSILFTYFIIEQKKQVGIGDTMDI